MNEISESVEAPKADVKEEKDEKVKEEEAKTE